MRCAYFSFWIVVYNFIE